MKRSCVFLDRDGVINVAPPEGEYVIRWEQFRFVPGVVDWIRLFNALGHLVIVVTNQRSVALGLVSGEALAALHGRMREELAAKGARIDDVYCCPHEEGVCECRKPRPGMVLAAARKWKIDLGRSILIGDSERDRGLAGNAGLTYVEVRDGRVSEVVTATAS